MDAYEAVDTVLAVRRFKADPVPDDVVQKIVAAAHRSASAGNKQPWHFVVVRDRETLRRIGRLARTGPYNLGIPDDLKLLAVLPFGYPVHPTRRGKKNRKPLGNVVSSERFGDAFVGAE